MVQPAMHRRRKTSPKEAGRAAQREEGTATQHRNHGEDEDGLNTKAYKTRSDNKQGALVAKRHVTQLKSTL